MTKTKIKMIKCWKLGDVEVPCATCDCEHGKSGTERMIKVHLRHMDGRIDVHETKEAGIGVVEIPESDWQEYREFCVKDREWHDYFQLLSNSEYEARKKK